MALCRRRAGRRRRLPASDGATGGAGKYIEIGGFVPDEGPEDLKQATRVNLAHYREQCANE